MTPTHSGRRQRAREACQRSWTSVIGTARRYVLTACLLLMATTCEANPPIPPPFLGPIEMPLRLTLYNPVRDRPHPSTLYIEFKVHSLLIRQPTQDGSAQFTWSITCPAEGCAYWTLNRRRKG